MQRHKNYCVSQAEEVDKYIASLASGNYKSV